MADQAFFRLQIQNAISGAIMRGVMAVVILFAAPYVPEWTAQMSGDVGADLSGRGVATALPAVATAVDRQRSGHRFVHLPRASPAPDAAP